MLLEVTEILVASADKKSKGWLTRQKLFPRLEKRYKLRLPKWQLMACFIQATPYGIKVPSAVPDWYLDPN